MKQHWKTLFALSLSALATSSWASSDKLQLENCHLDGIKQQVQCGTLTVPENYSKPDGDEIKINFAVLPAIDNSQNKEPLMFLAGGPGQAAVELAAGLFDAFNEVRKTRDLILIDQRGTGKSHPLQCEEVAEQSPYAMLPEEFTAKEVKECLSTLKGDLSQYNSENAIRDFDEVRKALGHQKINIYGGSYGTRAGLVYMRMFPESLRAVVLDSVGPVEVPIGLFGKSAARSFEKLLGNCQADEACKKAYPNLASEFSVLAQRLDEAPVVERIPHPRLGTMTDFIINKNKLINALRMQLYSVQTRSLVPLVVHQAYLGNYAPLAGLIAQTDGSAGMYVGLTFNIVCNEDIPRVTEQDRINDANNSFGGANSHMAWVTACPVWPQYRPDESFYQPVTANIPTLIISGDLDPVTPPSNGDYTAKTLPNSKHIVLKNSAHTPGPTTCAINVIDEFLSKLEPNNLDESCLDKIPNETFMTGLNGSI